MPMRPCQMCLENNWSYEVIDGWVKATCNQCSYEVEWEIKKKTRKTRIEKPINKKRQKKGGIKFEQFIKGKWIEVGNSTQLKGKHKARLANRNNK